MYLINLETRTLNSWRFVTIQLIFFLVQNIAIWSTEQNVRQFLKVHFYKLLRDLSFNFFIFSVGIPAAGPFWRLWFYTKIEWTVYFTWKCFSTIKTRLQHTVQTQNLDDRWHFFLIFPLLSLYSTDIGKIGNWSFKF